MKSVGVILTLSLAVTSQSAVACSDPSEQWYVNVSDVIFDGSAVCDSEKRSCRIRVNRVLKNPLYLVVDRRPITVDFQNWYADYMAEHPDEIILACGVPYFEPEQQKFRARFYANLDKKTSELIIRKYRIRNTEPFPSVGE
jgi:hypothetical protein